MRRGIALVLVSGILSILALVAAVLVRVSAVSRETSRGLVDVARARLLASSGIECAAARLTRAPEPAPGATSYADDWTYRDGPGVLLDRARNPSYNVGDRYADAGGAAGDRRYVAGDDFVTVDRDGNGQYDGWSGRLRGATAAFESRFSLRIESEEGKIHVNGGYLGAGDGNAVDPANGTSDHRDAAAGYNAVLCRILDNLGADPEVGVPGLGNLAIGARPAGGYASLADLYARTGISGKDLSPYLTCSAWIDRSVIRPNVAAAHVRGSSNALADVIVERGGAPILEPAGRAPVSVQCASLPVLQALLRGLQGVYRTRWVNTGSSTGLASVSQSLTDAQAAAVALKIVEVRAGNEDLNRNGYLDAGEDADGDGFLDSPFLHWDQFHAFCDSLVRMGVVTASVGDYITQPARTGAAADLLKANFNPNSDLNKSNPDRNLYREIDKSDLLVSSTEFSLHPMTGVFAVESLGVLRSPPSVPGCVRSTAACAIRLYHPIRQTSQADFLGGRADMLECVTPMEFSGLSGTFRTHGASKGWGGAPGRGLSLATYPEPPAALRPGGAGPALYDGQIALATTELPNDPAPDGAMFLHRFTDDWTADQGAAALSPLATIIDYGTGLPQGGSLQWDPSRSVQDAARPGTLLPDGAHSQPRRIPMYESVGNLPATHCAILFWTKRGARPSDYDVDMSVMGASSLMMSGTQWFGIGSLCLPSLDRWGMAIEDATTSGDNTHERRRMSWTTQYAQLLQRWVLVSAGWDISEVQPDAGTWYRQLDRTGIMTSVELYTWSLSGTPAPLPDISRRLLIGGSNSTAQWPAVYGCHAVIDEVATYDWPGSAADQQTMTWTQADTLFQDGRYYKGNDGRFTSVDLAGGLPAPSCRIARLYWTALLPRNPTVTVPSAPQTWDPTLRDARLQIELLSGPDPAPAVLHDTESFPPQEYARSTRVGAAVGAGPLRYRVTFKPTPTWPAADLMDAPVLETPFLDDVTILLQPAGFPKILRWTSS